MSSSSRGEALSGELEPYSFFQRCLEKPSAEQLALFQHPQFPSLLAGLAADLGEALLAWEPPPTFADLEATYISLFEVGLPAPPIPLLCSHYCHRDPVPKVLHEHMLFYTTFVLAPRDDDDETADHLLNELDFLAALSRLEAAAVETERARPVRLAKRDFLARQLLAWLPEAAAKAEDLAPPLFVALLSLLLAAARADHQRQEAWLAAHPEAETSAKTATD